MHIIDGIAFADNKSIAIKVMAVRPLDDYKLWLKFNTGEERNFDFTSLLNEPAFGPLKEKKNFESVCIEHGVTVWMDGEIDIAPEYLYKHAINIDKGSC